MDENLQSSPRRREFLAAAAATLAAATLPAEEARAQQPAGAEVSGTEHWTTKRADGRDIRLFLWRKQLRNAGAERRGTVLFVHGSSVPSTPAFDLQVPGKPEYSVMDRFARWGYDAWCFDCEGYGRSDKSRPINADVATGADDVAAALEYIVRTTGEPQAMIYGGSSGALRAGLYAQRRPERVKRLALDALVWTGEGSRTLAKRRENLAKWRASNRRPIDHTMVESIFTRDHPGTADPAVVKAFADAILALDTSMPTGTYLDMSANLPLLDPEKIKAPTLVMRGEFDGIAAFQDVAAFFSKLPNPDKQFAVMPGIAHSSLHEKNFATVQHILHGFFSQPIPVYTG
jgi:pimeloyl-ACP methyl ester carboxylesterase